MRPAYASTFTRRARMQRESRLRPSTTGTLQLWKTIERHHDRDNFRSIIPGLPFPLAVVISSMNIISRGPLPERFRSVQFDYQTHTRGERQAKSGFVAARQGGHRYNGGRNLAP